jgi:periplasmic protein TonB
MKTRSILIASYEIKRPYQRNLAIGFGISSFIPLMAAAIIVTYFQPAPAEIPPTKVDKPPIPVNLRNDPAGKEIFIPEPRKVEKINTVGIPVAVDDTIAPIDISLSDQKTLASLIDYIPIEQLGSAIVVNSDKVFKEAFPPIDSFIPVDEQPVQITMPQPKYPELARKAGIERKLFVKALIDKDGFVKKAFVDKPDSSDIGFEAAAIEAAMQSTWRPAICNGQPLAVWVTYLVVFKLK